MKTRNKRPLITIILTIAVIGILLYSGPAEAITVGITDLTSGANEQTAVTFKAKVDLHTNDILLENVNLTVNMTNTIGQPNASCIFSLAGTELSACSGITVTVESTNLGVRNYTNGTLYGYGYHFSQGLYTTNTTDYNASLGHGYAYNPGYGYDTFNTTLKTTAEMVYSVSWTLPDVTANTEYTVSLSAYVTDGVTNVRYETYGGNYDTITVAKVTQGGGGDSGGGSSGGSSSSGTALSFPSTPAAATLPSATDLGAPSGYSQVTQVGAQTSVASEISTADLASAIASASGAAQQLLQQLQNVASSGSGSLLNVQTTLNVYEVKNPATGQSVYRSVIRIQTVATEAGSVDIVEVIPKSVAQDVSQLLFPDGMPEILQADPIVKWSFNNVYQGQVLETSYVVQSKLTSVTSDTIPVLTKKVVPTPTPTPKKGLQDTTGRAVEPTTPTKGRTPTWPIIVVLVVLIIAGAYAYMKGLRKSHY